MSDPQELHLDETVTDQDADVPEAADDEPDGGDDNRDPDEDDPPTAGTSAPADRAGDGT